MAARTTSGPTFLSGRCLLLGLPLWTLHFGEQHILTSLERVVMRSSSRRRHGVHARSRARRLAIRRCRRSGSLPSPRAKRSRTPNGFLAVRHPLQVYFPRGFASSAFSPFSPVSALLQPSGEIAGSLASRSAYSKIVSTSMPRASATASSHVSRTAHRPFRYLRRLLVLREIVSGVEGLYCGCLSRIGATCCCHARGVVHRERQFFPSVPQHGDSA